MADLKFEIDVDRIASTFGELKQEVESDIVEGVSSVAQMTHAKVLELARDRLRSLSQMYMENVEFQNPEPNFWIVSLKNPALWVEEGRKCVVYGNNKDHIPKVLTPDGEIPITKLKKGMLVLNQYGKWTKVLDIYDEHLVEKSKLKVQEIKACRYAPHNSKLNKRIYSLGFYTKCPTCGETRLHEKLNNKRRAKSYCSNCLANQNVYKLKVSGHLSKVGGKNGRNWRTMYLTGDHRVMTQDGWKEIQNINPKKDKLKVPSWLKCKNCNKPTFMYSDFCYDKEGGKCSSSYYCKETLKNGNHQSQKPGARAEYLRRMQKLQKVNNTEERVRDLIEKTNTCDIWSESAKADFIREYPVKVPSEGCYKYKYFYMDFYSPKLKLCIEVDGKDFHCSKRDSERDKLIKQTLGCDIIRIPAKRVWKKDFYEKTLLPIIKNHSDDIEMLDFSAYKVEKKKMSRCSPTNRRWDITVEEGESFVCNRVVIHNSGFMEELLNGKSGKINKKGERYAVIPFEHNKNPSMQAPQAQSIANEIKDFLKKKKINWQKIEYDSSGSPRMGKIHGPFNIGDKNARLKEGHKSPATYGVSIYQRMKNGQPKKDVMTFRVIHEKHREEGKWYHPGKQGEFLMDEALDWAMNLFDNQILPDILRKHGG